MEIVGMDGSFGVGREFKFHFLSFHSSAKWHQQCKSMDDGFLNDFPIFQFEEGALDEADEILDINSSDISRPQGNPLQNPHFSLTTLSRQAPNGKVGGISLIRPPPAYASNEGGSTDSAVAFDSNSIQEVNTSSSSSQEGGKEPEDGQRQRSVFCKSGLK
jgi:hypothetical protein